MNIRLGIVTLLVASAFLLPRAAVAAGFQSPDECKAYQGDAHLNCLYAYIELQKDRLQKIDQEQQTQRQRLDQLDNRITQQSAMQQSAINEGAVSSAPPPVVPAPAYPAYGYGGYGGYGYGYPFSYWYPSPGLSIFLGPGRVWGRPYIYGPRFYGPRFYGPRFYGGRGFGHRRW